MGYKLGRSAPRRQTGAAIVQTYCGATGKRSYGSPKQARQAHRTCSNRLRVYFCRACRGYHATDAEGDRR